eukprot:14850808-Alexandrium_andersonii.AAC.1
MSASLVGSEMCIRDRIQTRWLRCEELPPQGRVALQCWGHWCPRGPYRCCLLYTSDAADDM